MTILETSEPIVVAFALNDSRDLALSKLFKNHHKKLHTFISARVRDPADSQELTGQAFLEACRGLASFRGESELGTWLYGIAMNLIRSHIRRAVERRCEFVGEEVLEDVEDGGETPMQCLAAKQSVQRLQKHLDDLPADLRDALLMVTLDELSYEEAAERLRIPVGTVRSRVWRSRMLLRERLAAEGIVVPAGRGRQKLEDTAAVE